MAPGVQLVVFMSAVVLDRPAPGGLAAPAVHLPPLRPDPAAGGGARAGASGNAPRARARVRAQPRRAWPRGRGGLGFVPPGPADLWASQTGGPGWFWPRGCWWSLSGWCVPSGWWSAGPPRSWSSSTQTWATTARGQHQRVISVPGRRGAGSCRRTGTCSPPRWSGWRCSSTPVALRYPELFVDVAAPLLGRSPSELLERIGPGPRDRCGWPSASTGHRRGDPGARPGGGGPGAGLGPHLPARTARRAGGRLRRAGGAE